MEARQHGTTLYTSVFRFDDTLLVNTHAYGAAASHSPVMHLHKVAGGRLFNHYMTSLRARLGQRLARDLPTRATKLADMGRIDYVDDPDAPEANSVVPSVVAIVQDDRGRVL